MGSIFKVTYKTDDNEPGKGTIYGPKDKTVEDCLKIVRLASSKYHILPDTVVAVQIPESLSHGFRHPLQALTPDGRTATITRWYY